MRRLGAAHAAVQAGAAADERVATAQASARAEEARKQQLVLQGAVAEATARLRSEARREVRARAWYLVSVSGGWGQRPPAMTCFDFLCQKPVGRPAAAPTAYVAPSQVLACSAVRSAQGRC